MKDAAAEEAQHDVEQLATIVSGCNEISNIKILIL